MHDHEAWIGTSCPLRTLSSSRMMQIISSRIEHSTLAGFLASVKTRESHHCTLKLCRVQSWKLSGVNTEAVTQGQLPLRAALNTSGPWRVNSISCNTEAPLRRREGFLPWVLLYSCPLAFFQPHSVLLKTHNFANWLQFVRNSTPNGSQPIQSKL